LLPRDFRLLADDLFLKSYLFKNYICSAYRTSISRYYYYIFLETREVLNANFKREDKDIFNGYKDKHHCLIPKILLFLGNLSKKKMLTKASRKFENLRYKRNECDYEISINLRKEDVEDAKYDIEFIENAILIIPQIENIRDLLSQSLKIALNECKKYKVKQI
jgi:uncharacterized protein (UPF0332 family)